MAINPSMTLVKVLRISDSMTNISNEKKDINVPHNMIWICIYATFPFSFSFSTQLSTLDIGYDFTPRLLVALFFPLLHFICFLVIYIQLKPTNYSI